jgi:hypothetical protein
MLRQIDFDNGHWLGDIQIAPRWDARRIALHQWATACFHAATTGAPEPPREPRS